MNDTEPAASDDPREGTPDAASEAPVEPPSPSINEFAALGLDDALVQALTGLGYEEPTPVQREAIPIVLTGADVVAQAATGTGKTAAFALPILQSIGAGAPKVPHALVVVPTRELAVQVSEAIFKYGRRFGIEVLPVFGGQPIGRQLDQLRRGVHVVVATPGRAIDHIKRGSLELDQIATVVLDEADEMLDMGFAEDIEAILEATPATRQTVMFSATMPPRIAAIARKYLHDAVRVEIGRSREESGQGSIRQSVYFVQRQHKASALGRILDVEDPAATIVFCRTRYEVDDLTVTMNGRGYRAEALHGGMDQVQRDKVMARLRDGTAELLLATDVAARGLDVDTLTHVVNYDVPAAPESYVHRIGRVGRAGREGVAITLAEPRERRQIANIERLMGKTIEVRKVPTVADLRERQVEQTVEELSEALGADDLDDYRPVINAFAGEDPWAIALAAIKLVHDARGATLDTEEIPEAVFEKRFDKRGERAGAGGKFGDRDKKAGKGPRVNPGTGFVYVNVGKKAGVRPADLVGSVANQAGLSGAQIGPIRIADFYSVVGVPDEQVDHVVGSLRGALIRNKPVTARRFVEK